MGVNLKSDETALYSFQHPDNGAAMVLKLDEADNPCVEVEEWVLDSASPEEKRTLVIMAARFTKAVCRMDDLYEAARKLSAAPYYCEDILS